MAKTRAFAPAKINLALHVTGQRADGYHLLDSLVVFADIGDTITAEAADKLSLQVDGPMAEGVPTDGSNLVLKAAQLLQDTSAAQHGAALTLTKHLPAASGIGGGSSDAAACLRALSALWNVTCPKPSSTLPLGADLPVCIDPAPQRMRGIGERLTPVDHVPQLAIVLANPKVHVPTPGVFKAMTHRENAPMEETLPRWADLDDFIAWLAETRNDMQPAAETIAPAITKCLQAIAATNAVQLTRMSGSGATCFGLYRTKEDAQAAKTAIETAHPDWWVAAGTTGATPVL